MLRTEEFAAYREDLAGFRFRFAPFAFITQNQTEVSYCIRHIKIFGAIQFVKNVQAFERRGFCLRQFPSLPIHAAKVVQRRSDLRAGVSEPLPTNGKRPHVHFLCFGQFALRQERHAQIIESRDATCGLCGPVRFS